MNINNDPYMGEGGEESPCRQMGAAQFDLGDPFQ